MRRRAFDAKLGDKKRVSKRKRLTPRLRKEIEDILEEDSTLLKRLAKA